ncbi:hypothetical protein HNY73_003294 [Argiope bruennichi]|uniref:Uncharacterized protein n=1 Tax=Argiope bruennichi TaxID=94029 RepID=A0A8T0G0U2_ARGBR|nr:hypothetical protein HNY73_003294 [Argiope bruennichi]
MSLLPNRKFIAFILCYVISASLGQTINQTLKLHQRTGRIGTLSNHDNWSAHKKVSHKVSSNAVTSSLDSSHGFLPSDSFKNSVLSELDDIIPDRTVDVKYSYSPGGFYIPHEREAKHNYHFEEVTDNDDKDENKGRTPDEELVKVSDSKILTGSSQTEIGVTERPTFLSVFKKAFLNPLVVVSVSVIPLAFIIEMITPYISNIFIGNMLPTVATTIASGFARGLDDDTALQVEQVLDVINEFGVRALEDPKCLQRFLCQGVKYQTESHSEGSRSIHRIVHNLANSVNDEVLNKYGLKPLLNSVQSGDCESLTCKGSSAYSQDIPLFEKLYLLGTKVYNLTKKNELK